MRHARLFPILATVLVLMVAFAGCHTTKTPREQISDSAIHAAVKAKLTVERFSNLVNVDVNVTNGVVTLAGEVPNEDVRRDAVAEARSVDGVRRVIDNLQVSHPSRQ